MTHLLVVLAAVANACALVLLRRSAGREPAPTFGLQQLRAMLRCRTWAAGMLTLMVGGVLQATALALGAVTNVQLIITLELPMTLVLASIVLGGRLRTREWTAIAAMTVGVVLVLVSLEPRGGSPYTSGPATWIAAAAATVALVGGLVLVGRLRGGATRPAMFGIATGATSGLIAVLVSAVLTVATRGGVGGVLSTWWTYLLILAVPAGFLLLQSAVAAGMLVASQPGITLGNPIVAALWGIGIFGEDVRTGGWLVAAALGALLVVAGVLLLVRSPPMHRLQAPVDGSTG